MGMRDIQRLLRREMTESITPGPDPAFKFISKTATAFLIWRIENLQVVPVPKEHYGTFFEGDSYIVYAASERGQFVGPGVKCAEVKGSLEMHIHFWLGAETSQDESAVAAYKTVELDDYLSGCPVQHREVQGCESSRFKAYFKNGIRLLKGGINSGLNHISDTFEPRLFRVKGRRTPIVQQMPSISWDYFNKGDVFIIDTNDVIFVWVGSGANNIEKLQATKVAVQLRDEHSAVSIVFVDDGKENDLPESERLLLGVYLDLSPVVRNAIKKSADDDRQFEYIERSALKLYQCSDENGTYKVTEIKSGPLSQSDLNSNVRRIAVFSLNNHVYTQLETANRESSSDSFIIDNGSSGIWVWIGKKASTNERVEAMRNAYGFVKKKNYPSSTPVSRVVESGEPMEFKALFSSWNEKDVTLNHVRNSPTSPKAKHLATKLDAATLHALPKLAAETQLVDDGSGTVTIWRVSKTNLIEVPSESHGIFYGGDCYLIHYVYSTGGRDHHLIYYWIGQHSSVTEQTALAIHAVTKDNDIGGIATQVRVIQGKESPHFLAILKGKMIIFSGEYQKLAPAKFLLQVHGNRTDNTRATEVEFRAASLNSNDVFVVRNAGDCFVWCGKGSTGDEREMAKSIAGFIDNSEYAVVYEGQEKADFWETLGGQEAYANDKRLAAPENSVPARLFHCSNATGTFRVEEIVNFSQTDLVTEDVMLLDTWNAIFIWIGTLSNKEERTQSLKLAFEYLETDPLGRDESTPIYQIRQGYEPPNFTGFFGAWDLRLWEALKTFEELRDELENQKPVLQVELRVSSGIQDFNECDKHSIESLLPREPEKLPTGVNPLHKELYLTQEDFINAFGMRYLDFASLPKWRQENLKKAAGLF